MTEAAWSFVDDFITEKLMSPQRAQQETLRLNQQAGLPAIDVSPPLGKLLYLLVCLGGAQQILEIGTLGGYSTIWLARALGPQGKVVSIDVDRKHLSVARENLVREGLNERVELRLGRGREVLDKLKEENCSPFDFSFIDADKENNAYYFNCAVELSRPGALIFVDNVIRAGGVTDPESADEGAQGARRLFDVISADSRVEATALQTVGSKGWDGFLIARVNAK
jgi:predicted O-methyltransferase YrrM